MNLASRTPVVDLSSADATPLNREGIVVSFIVPALNEEKYIGSCLQSIRQLEMPQGIHGVEVIVVDNHSTDRTADISHTMGAKVLRVAPGHPSRARNAGARSAQGDWLAFIDADCELAKDWLVICGSHLLNDSRVVAAAGAMGKPGPAASWIERAWHEIAHGQNSGETQQVRWLPTFNLLVHRAKFESVGGYDESLQTCEDCALGYRLSELGMLLVDAHTQVAHLGQSHTLRDLFRREAWRTRDNLRLAVSRPLDWSNWLSLVLPPGLVAAFLLSTAGAIASLVWSWNPWPSLAIFVTTIIAMALLACRKSLPASVQSFAQRLVVFSTYLVGRTAGLLWPFRRADR